MSPDLTEQEMCPAGIAVLPAWGAMTKAARDAAYNNTAAVTDVADLHAARTAASEAARRRTPALLDIRYGAAVRQLVDLFPASDPRAPCLMFIHGGYWQMNSKDSFTCLADGVRAAGWAAALPGYSLAPDASLSDIVCEVRAAIRWLAAEGPGYGIAGPLVLSGWSAGAHLAALALAEAPVLAGLGISGIYELGPLRDTYLNEKLRLRDAEIATLSPLRLPPVTKPFALAYGTAELPALVLNSRHMHAHRAAAHTAGPLIPVAGCNHFTVLDGLQTPAGILTRQLLALVDG